MRPIWGLGFFLTVCIFGIPSEITGWLIHAVWGEILIFTDGKSSFLMGAKNEDKTMLCVVPPPRSCSAPAVELVAVPSGPRLGAGVTLSWQQTP